MRQVQNPNPRLIQCVAKGDFTGFELLNQVGRERHDDKSILCGLTKFMR
jgi:hypothetical protein